MRSTPSSQVHIYGTGGWHPAAGREGAYRTLPAVAFSTPEVR